MADRRGGEGKPGVPKEIFELDKDERWQARLDEARARREIALREKAAGKPQKPRPKPWEVDGSSVAAPPKIEPIIQERGDDKFDFADRLETIRDAKTDGATAPKVAKSAPKAKPTVRAKPPSPVTEVAPPPPPRPQPAAPAPTARARPQPSLILPGAPDVADLAARYAATLEETDDRDLPVEPDEPESAPAQTAELVTLPTAALPPEHEAPKPLTRAERRRGIRPLGMAIGLIALAVLPLGSESPPLEVGPDMPEIDVFRFQPALGITWSLYERPTFTRSGEWLPEPAPAKLAPYPFFGPATVSDEVPLLAAPQPGSVGVIDWGHVGPVTPPLPKVLASPRGEIPTPPALSVQPPSPDTPVEAPTAVVAPDADGAVSAPPRPETLLEDGARPPDPPERQGVSEVSAVAGSPLRITILRPTRTDRALADDIASRVQNDGHELVRVKDVETSISQRNVRFFHEADRASAARMAERYDAELRDFTWFQPKPAAGTAELWLVGRAPSGNTNGRTQPAPISPDEQGELLERVFERLGLGTELPDALSEGSRTDN